MRCGVESSGSHSIPSEVVVDESVTEVDTKEEVREFDEATVPEDDEREVCSVGVSASDNAVVELSTENTEKITVPFTVAVQLQVDRMNPKELP